MAEPTRRRRGRSMILSLVLMLIVSGRSHDHGLESRLGVVREVVNELVLFLDALNG